MADEKQNIQDTLKESPRQHDLHRRPLNREQVPRPAEKVQELKEVGLDDDETEQDRKSALSRQPRGGTRGKPPKRVIEEWASDIYCE